MKVKTISVTNFAGVEHADWQCAPITVLTGPMASGKTTVTRALRLALIGQDPDLGGRPADTFQLASGDSMGIRVAFDNGAIAAFGQTMKRGSIKTQFSPAFEEPLPRVAIDPRWYFDLTERERIEFIFARCQVEDDGFSRDNLVGQVKQLKLNDCEPEAAEAALQVVINMIDRVYQQAADEEWPIQQFATATVESLTEAARRSKDTVDRMKASQQASAQNNLAQAPNFRANVSTIIRNVRGELQNLNSQIKERSAEITRQQATEARRRQLTDALAGEPSIRANRENTLAQIERVNKALAANADTQARLEHLNVRLADLNRSRQMLVTTIELNKRSSEEMEGKRKLVEGLNADLQKWDAAIAPAQAKFDAEGAALAAFRSEVADTSALLTIARATANVLQQQCQAIWQVIEDCDTEAKRLGSLECCPTCSASGTGWRVKKQQEIAERRETAAQKYAKLGIDIKAKTEEVVALTTKLQVAQADELANQAARKQHAAAELELVSMRANRDIALRRLAATQYSADAHADIGRALVDQVAHNETMGIEIQHVQADIETFTNPEISKLQGELAGLQNELKTFDQLITAAQKFRGELEALPAPMVIWLLVENNTRATEQRDKLERELVDLEQEERRFIANTEVQRQRELAAQALRLAASEAQAFTAAKKIADNLRDQMRDKAITQLTSKAGRFTDGILKTPITFKDGELGRWQGSQWVAHAVFSGGERTLAYAGLCYAMSHDAAYRVAIIDEFATIGLVEQVLVVQRIADMISAGELDQAFICCRDPLPPEVADLKFTTTIKF